jgi:hypothetical protein
MFYKWVDNFLDDNWWLGMELCNRKLVFIAFFLKYRGLNSGLMLVKCYTTSATPPPKKFVVNMNINNNLEKVI